MDAIMTDYRETAHPLQWCAMNTAIEHARAAQAAGVPVWTKDNLRGICPPTHWRQEKPET